MRGNRFRASRCSRCTRCSANSPTSPWIARARPKPATSTSVPLSASKSATARRPASSAACFAGVEPVPGLILVAVAVALGERQYETEAPGVAAQPGEGRCALELDLERRRLVGGDVDGAPGVVLAVAGRRAGGKDLLQRRAVGELPPQDPALPIDAAKGRDEIEHHALGGGCLLHPAFRSVDRQVEIVREKLAD